MITLFFILISIAVISSLGLNLFLLRMISTSFQTMMYGSNTLHRDLCLLKERIENILDIIEKKDKNKNLNVISEEERQERWNRIRKAFEKKEREKDGSS